jgi:alkanesulfonate monooxygenase SsuD/methylene tetrahydromethanopterin reductase-like flavin-dependent oxidoreductase (luciferase family)
MLSIGAPHIDAWNEWHDRFGNQPENLPPLMSAVDEAARAAGRDPAQIERTVTVLVHMTGGKGRGSSYVKPTPPHEGTQPDEMAAMLRRYAEAGISHVQLVLDPITRESIEECAPILERLDRT